MTPALEVRGLWKGYVAGVPGCSARVSVLRGVSFSVAHGERVGIIGGPGAGKTTLLHCIDGLRRPDTGFVRMIHDPAEPVLLLDDGWGMDAMNLRSPRRTALLFGRELQALTAYVDRVLLLRDGRVVAPESEHVGARRCVAERGVGDDARAVAIR